MIFRYLLPIFLCFYSQCANSAEITLEPLNDSDTNRTQVIFVTGEMFQADVAQFKSVSQNLPAGSLVLLSSPGGAVTAGIEIGREIRSRHFNTGVIDTCASACALAWLGGETRSFARNARIGFHVAYYGGEVKQESGMGNALVGLYVGELGFKDNVVKYITSASPDDMQWITERDALLLGIDAIVVDINPAKDASKDATNSPAETNVKIQKISELELESVGFIMQVINTNTMDSTAALKSVLNNYSSTVDYFGDRKSLPEIYADKSKYFERWPIRLVSVKKDSLAVKCESSICSVSGVYEWTVKNSNKNKVKSGTALFNYKVEMGETPKVVFEAGEVLKQQ